MDRTLNVRTPESIHFSYELAGLGSRFLAVAIDLCIQVLILLGIIWGLVLLGSHASREVSVSSSEDRLAQSIAIALIVAVVFMVFFGYFILFEALWNGQTPGKKALGIRVVRDGGYPVDFGSSLIRNLIRTGEFAMLFYLPSAISTLLSAENKRLGDFAAGTIVVRDTRAARPADFLRSSSPAPQTPLLNDDERALVARYAARRASMQPQHRAALAAQIANLLRPRVSRDLAVLDDDEMLQRLSAS